MRRARDIIAPHVHRTPLFSSRSLGPRTYLKAEHLQKTGSFKARAMLHAVSALSTEERARGLISMSAGNAAMALAFAATTLGARASIVMPEAAPASKIAATRGYGGEVILHPDRVTLPERLAREQAARGAVLVHPYDDVRVIAGNGSVGLEILDDLPEVDLVVVPVGGGGLISGVALAVKSARPGARVVGVEPRGAPTVRSALDAGAPKRLERIDTVADGLTAPVAGTICLEMVRALVDDVVVVDDEAILEGLRFLAARAKQVVEPAGAAAVGALLCGALATRPGERVVAVLSGGNVDADRFAGFLHPGQ